MPISCKNCAYAANAGEDIQFCLALACLIREDVPCKKRLYRELDETIPREEDLIEAFRELKNNEKL